jgi:hypothetical protein
VVVGALGGSGDFNVGARRYVGSDEVGETTLRVRCLLTG